MKVIFIRSFVGKGKLRMKKYKLCIISVTSVITLLIICVVFYFGDGNTEISWINDLSYENNQVYDISFGFFNPCPRIPVIINDKEVELEFDTGNGTGIFITTALKDKTDYEIIGTTTELNADGTYRGDGKSISLKSIIVYGEEYQNVISSLTDWRMYGFFKINGTIGLKYFDKKVITVDYKNKKIAVSSKIPDYSKLQNENFIILPLIKSSLTNQQDLLFFEGEVNGEKSTIYLDTGSTRSFYNFNATGAELEVKLGERTYHFKKNKLRQEEIGFQDKFRYPLKLAINSDLLKANHFIIIIDRIENKIIFNNSQ
jgi:hypothetical protein